LFVRQAEAHPSKPFIISADRREVSYAETRAMAARIAAKLRDDGVRPGDRVAMQVGKSPEAVALYLATQQLGAVILPLNTAYTPSEIGYFLENASPSVFVCSPVDAETHWNGDARPGLVVETLGVEGDGSLLDATTELSDVFAGADDDVAAILYTSGTTGRSKGATLTRGNLASNCLALVQAWEFTPDDRLIHALPIFHIHGLFVAVNVAMAAGATMHFLPGFDADAIIDLLPEATVLMGVPTFYTRMLASPRLDAAVCRDMRLFVAGSAPLLASDHRAFEERTDHAILERYGMTETGIICSNPYTSGPRRAGTVGVPLPGVEVRVVDPETGARKAVGEIGSVEVRGPNVFAGYWQMPKKTEAEFRADGFFITGDLGILDETGYLSIVGRSKDLVISGGYNIYPKEIEEHIDAHPDVLESAVIGVPHPDLGEVAVAVVVPAAGRTPQADEILASIAPNLARFKHPRTVRIVDSLPRNTMGKVQKAVLRSELDGLFRN
jgi:malonyl-CoA/methylmalonyl-CoA synthetase